jgi:hypothetical protein
LTQQWGIDKRGLAGRIKSRKLGHGSSSEIEDTDGKPTMKKWSNFCEWRGSKDHDPLRVIASKVVHDDTTKTKTPFVSCAHCPRPYIAIQESSSELLK